MEEPVLAEIQEQPETVTKLGELLASLKIKQVFYIDDYNNIDAFPAISVSVKELFDDDKKDLLQEIFVDLQTNVPDSDIYIEELAKNWEGYDSPKRKEIVSALSKAAALEFNEKDYDKTRELKNIFPENLITLVNPDEWVDLFDELSGKISADEKVLLIFDQDLTNAKGERFRSGGVNGQVLIVDIRKSAIKDNAYCALITHLIPATSDELSARDDIITELGGALTKKDFLALSKSRIDSPELFCDGIKKVVLNEYFEEIKDKSCTVLETAHIAAMETIKKLDTYDFDHTVLRSSYGEGVWEVDTLMRIAKNIYDEEIKKTMIATNYPEFVNPFLKKSKPVSDIRFNIGAGVEPYVKKYALRHNEIYEAGKIINQLYLPIENGDIFEITSGAGKGFYILVAQECDLMMRTNPMGSRTSDLAICVLLKIKQFTRADLHTKIVDYFTNNGPSSHYYANRFRLDYFIQGTTDVGIINFNEGILVNLDPLDLCVFNANGEGKITLPGTVNVDVLNIAWDERYKKLTKQCVKVADQLDVLIPAIEAIGNPHKDGVKRKMYEKISSVKNLGIALNYNNRNFDFGIKRFMRLKPIGAKYLLERYYNHLSRTAEPHDFAADID